MIKKFSLMLFCLFLVQAPVQAEDFLDPISVSLFEAQLKQAKKGDVRGQLYVGELYEQGLGTNRDLDQAHKWYSKSAASLVSSALFRVEAAITASTASSPIFWAHFSIPVLINIAVYDEPSSADARSAMIFSRS